MNSQRKRKKTKGKKRRLFPYLIGIFLIAFLGINIYEAVSSPIITELVHFGELENSVCTTGYVLRNEVLVPSPATGTLSCIVKEGERVSKGEKIASIYVGNADEATQIRLNRVLERLSEYSKDKETKNYLSEDIDAAEVQISNIIDAMIHSMQNKDMKAVGKNKEDLYILMDRYKKFNEQTTYAQLLKEKEQLQAELQSVRKDIYAPMPGVFSSKLDAYENFFDINNLSNITPTALQEADRLEYKENSKVEQGKPLIKIFDNYNWYYCAEVEPSFARDLKVGTKIQIRFTDISKKLLPATIESINWDDGGKVAIVLSCNHYEDSIYRLRKTNADIVLGRYKGLKIPKSAVRIQQDGTTGVFVLKDNIVRYKQVEILYTGEQYVIAKENNSDRKNVLLYDEVITSGKNLYDGQVV